MNRVIRERFDANITTDLQTFEFENVVNLFITSGGPDIVTITQIGTNAGDTLNTGNTFVLNGNGFTNVVVPAIVQNVIQKSVTLTVQVTAGAACRVSFTVLKLIED